MSIQLHCLSPMVEGLFQKAVMCSGGGVSRIMTYAPASRHYDFWHAVMQKAGCENLEAFRALSPEKLFDAWQTAKKEVKGGGVAAFPCRDGELITGNGVDILRAGKHLKIPYLCGSTSEDFGAPMLFSLEKNGVQRKRSHLTRGYLIAVFPVIIAVPGIPVTCGIGLERLIAAGVRWNKRTSSSAIR